MAKTKTQTGFQFKIELLDTSPPVWRRVLVPPQANLRDLHRIIQIAMGWTNSHMHEFLVQDKQYGPAVEGESDTPSEESVALSDIFKRKGEKILYIYDLGDYWEHTVEYEGPAPHDVTAPSLIDGEFGCPPEDCGGSPMFHQIREVLKDEDHPDFDEFDDMYGDGYLGEHFDPKAHDKALQHWQDSELFAFEDRFQLVAEDLLFEKDEGDEDIGILKDPDSIHEMEFEEREGEISPYLRRELIEAIGNQMRVGDPPFVKPTYQRLMAELRDEKEVLRLMSSVLFMEMGMIMQDGTEFMPERYEKMMDLLPDTEALTQMLDEEDPARLFDGNWEIVDSELWPKKELDKNGKAMLEIEGERGKIHLLDIDAELDLEHMGDTMHFCFEGTERDHPALGRGWLEMDEDGRLIGGLSFFMGDRGMIYAERADARNKNREKAKKKKRKKK